MSTAGRWFGVGSSDDACARTAAEQATRQALSGADPKLLLVFVSMDHDLQQVADAVTVAAPGVPMVGCTTAGEIATGAAGDGRVVVTALGGEGFSAATAVAENASSDLFAAGGSLAAVVGQLPSSAHQILLLLTDGLAGDQQEIVRGAYAEVGATIPLVGGCAGDAGAMVETSQLCDGVVHRDAVVGAIVTSDAPIGVGVRHGWQAVGEPMLVTHSEDTTVFELDDRPALEVYLEQLGAPDRLGRDLGAFTSFAMTHPLGLRRRSSEEVRFVSGADLAAGALTCIAEVPQGSQVWVMRGDVDSVLAGTTNACAEALEPLEGAEPLGLLVFDCIARRGVLGDEGMGAEMAAISACLPEIPFAGFYTYGEFARTSGVRGFHNQTLVSLAFA